MSGGPYSTVTWLRRIADEMERLSGGESFPLPSPSGSPHSELHWLAKILASLQAIELGEPGEGGGSMTDTEVAAAYERERSLMPQEEAEAGEATTKRLVNALILKQAINARIAELVDGSPEAFDTLKELSDALADQDDAVAALVTAISGKLSSSAVSAFILTLLDDANAAAARATLGTKWEDLSGLAVLRNAANEIIRVIDTEGAGPTSSNDVTTGIALNCIWEVSTNLVYKCTDNTEGAAVWVVVAPADVTAALAGKSSTSHNHSGVYDPAGTASSAVSTHAAVTSGVHGISAFGATLIDDADAAAARGTLGAAPAVSRQTFSNAAVTVTNGVTVLVQTGAVSAARTITLPAASAYAAGTALVIQDIGTGITYTTRLNITRGGTDTLNGGTSALPAIVAPRGVFVVYSDGVSDWAAPLAAHIPYNGNGLSLAVGQHGTGAAMAFNGAVDTLQFFSNGGSNLDLSKNAISMQSAQVFQWCASNAGTTADVILTRAAAGVLGKNGAIQFAQIASLGTPGSNTVRVGAKDVSGTAEFFVLDEAGNETQLSAHSSTAPSWLYESGTASPAEPVSYSANYYQGVVTYHHRITGAIYRETFAEHNERLELIGDRALVLLDWDEVQAGHVATREAERADWQTARDAWEAEPVETRGEWARREIPEVLAAKLRPPGLTDQTAVILAGRERDAARATLRAQWASQPAWIRGPFDDKFIAAQRFLDAGDDEAAAALIRFADAPGGYSPEQLSAFAALKETLADAIEALPS